MPGEATHLLWCATSRLVVPAATWVWEVARDVPLPETSAAVAYSTTLAVPWLGDAFAQG